MKDKAGADSLVLEQTGGYVSFAIIREESGKQRRKARANNFSLTCS